MKKKLTLLLFIGIILWGCLPSKPNAEIIVLPKENRPNIIVILADDLDERLGTIQYMENLQNLMVKQGTTVEDFIVTTPMCCPSRINILRSEYTHNHQIYNNEAPHGGFPKFFETGGEDSTLAVWLQLAGYRTALIGKYLNAYPLAENRTYVPAGWDEWVSPGRKNAYDGFDYYLNENGKLIAYQPSQENYFTDVMNRKSQDFIERASEEDVPFFLFLAPFVPHEPAVPAPRHAELLKDLQAPRTLSFNEADISDKPSDLSLSPLLNEKQIERIDEIYRNRVLSMLAVDEMIASVIQKLEETNQLDNTYIIFTSDQGFHLGQHRMLQGKSSFYEEDIIVPFIVRGPNIPKNESIPSLLTGTIDIAPTISEWAGVVPPEFTVGHSVANILEGNASSTMIRQAFLLETYAFSEEETVLNPNQQVNLLKVFSLAFPIFQSELPKWAGLRTLEYTYIEHPDGFIELYNLQNDPAQLENLALNIDTETLNILAVRLQELETCEGIECRQIDALPLFK